MKKLVLILLFLNGINSTRANNIDSLKQLIISNKSPNFHSSKYREIANVYSQSNVDSALFYYYKSLFVSKENKNDSLIFENWYSLADVYLKTGNYDLSFNMLDSCSIIFQNYSNSEHKVRVNSLIGGVNYSIGNYDEALSFYLKSLSYYQENSNEIQEAKLLYNIGNIYYIQKEYEQAKSKFQQSLVLREKNNDFKGTYYVLNGLGTIYRVQEMYDQALFYLQKSLAVGEKIENLYFISNGYNNIGNVYLSSNKIDSAIFYYDKSLEIRRILGDKKSLAQTLNNFGEIFILNKKEFKKGIASCLEAYGIVKDINSKFDVQQSCSCLSVGYEKLHDFENAFKYYRLYSIYKDSLFNETKSKEIGKLEATYEMEKKQSEEEQKLKEESRKLKKETERRDNIQYSVIFIAILAVFGTILSLGFIKVSPQFAEGLIFFAFLIFFEFCLVLLDPYVDKYSGGEPAYKLLFNAVLAGAIFPVHAFFEGLIKKRLIN